MNADDLIEILMDYYNVSSNNELAIKLNMQPSSISSWKNKNSVNAIKKKCRELGIHKEIFGDMNVQTVMSNEGLLAQNVGGNQMSSPANQNEKIINDEVDPATYNLFLEAYKKAIEENNLKSFRLHLMEY